MRMMYTQVMLDISRTLFVHSSSTKKIVQSPRYMALLSSISVTNLCEWLEICLNAALSAKNCILEFFCFVIFANLVPLSTNQASTNGTNFDHFIAMES